MTQAKLLYLDLGKVDPPEGALRKTIDPDKIADLADSINNLGLLSPLIVRKDGDRWRIVAGHRRYLAVKSLQWERVPAFERPDKAEDTLATKIAENAARENLNPVEEAHAAHALIHDLGFDIDQAARHIGKSRSWIERRLGIYALPLDLQDPLAKDLISIGAAYELAKVTDPGYRHYLTENAVRGGCTTFTARMWAQEWEGRQQPTMTPPSGNDGPPIYLPPPHTGLACSNCGTLTSLNDLITLHVCRTCYAGPKETPR